MRWQWFSNGEISIPASRCAASVAGGRRRRDRCRRVRRPHPPHGSNRSDFADRRPAGYDRLPAGASRFRPCFRAPPDQAAATELSLRRMVVSLAETLSRHPAIRIVNAQLLDENSPPAKRYDLKSDVSTGFPQGSSLSTPLQAGELIAGLIHNRPPKKGLITDLDDTLWSGILGDEGVEGVSWTVNHGSHLHGLYQQFLASLASAGVLIGVASKNDRATVDLAFERQDLLISKNDIFPIEAHWSGKSKSVERILATWNVSADAVVFIDDSRMEAAEVKAAFPEMECIVFPKDDYSAFWNSTGKSPSRRLREIDSYRRRRAPVEQHSGFRGLAGCGPIFRWRFR